MTLTGKRLDFLSPPRKKAPVSAGSAFEKSLAETLGALEEDPWSSRTEVFEIPPARYLTYKAFDKKQRTILVPALGLTREEAAPPPEKPREDTGEDLRALVKARKKSTEPCPKCGSLDIVPIMYGLPGPEMMEAANRGKIALGGCCVGDRDPQKECKACGVQFDFRPLQVSRRARRKTRS